MIFFLIYCPQNIVLNGMSEILKNNFGELGFLLNGIMYLFQMVGALAVPSMAKSFGLKKMFVFGGFLFALSLFSQILPAWYNELQGDDEVQQKAKVEAAWYGFLVNKSFITVILFVSNALAGIGVAMIWIPQGEYMSLCATEDTKGFYFGYFWVWYMSAQIIGNLAGAIMIKKTMGPSFFIMLSIAEILFFSLFCFIRLPVKVRETEEEEKEEE